MVNFYCKSLKLDGFRGFHKITEINFHKRLNVLFGVNGSGKSSLLRALSFFLSELTEGSKTDITPEDNDINNNSNLFELGLELVFENKIISSIKLDHLKNLERIEPLSQSIKEKQIPLVVSYSVVRHLRNGFSQDMISLISHPDAHLESFNSEIDFTGLIRWLNLEEALELQQKIEKTDISSIAEGKEVKTDHAPVSKLDLVRNAIKSFTGLSQLSLDRTTDPISLKALKGNHELNSVQMSEGERCLLALVGDIAWRLIRLNNDLDNPLNGAGIVLIDEIDLHLHPKWQRMIIPGLVKTFPNVQFIVTTHSPQILGEVMGESLFALEQIDGDIEVIRKKQGKALDSNMILEELMETDSVSKEPQKLINDIFNFIDDEDYSVASDKIEKFKRKYNGDIPKIIEAETLIELYGGQEK